MTRASDLGLIRGIHRWDLVALVLNSIIGAGIFGLPSKLFGLAGTYCLIAYVVCAVAVVLIILCFAELGSRYRTTGGPYLYTLQAFGPLVGFEIGWLVWLARLTAFAAICNLFVGYLGHFWPACEEGWRRVLVIVAVVASLAIVNVIGVRKAALVSNVFTVAKLIPLLLFITAGLFFIERRNFALGSPPSYSAFSNAALLLVFAFTGFESSIIPTGETSEPRRDVPFALLVGIGIVVLLYVLIQFVCIGTLPNLAASPRPLADAANRFLGPVGAAVVSIGALVSVIGNLNGTMLAAPRLLFAMAEHRQLPRVFLTTHRRFHTPYLAILVSALVMLGLTLWSRFISALTISAVIRLISYAATCAVVPVLRRKPDIPAAAFMAPAGVPVAVAGLGLCAWLFSNSSWYEARVVTLSAALGLLLHVVCQMARSDAASPSAD